LASANAALGSATLARRRRGGLTDRMLAGDGSTKITTPKRLKGVARYLEG
jgi:hypothetical protein